MKSVCSALPAASVFELFHELAAQGKSVVIVTHDSSLAGRTHRTTLIADGEIVDAGAAQPVYAAALAGD